MASSPFPRSTTPLCHTLSRVSTNVDWHIDTQAGGYKVSQKPLAVWTHVGPAPVGLWVNCSTAPTKSGNVRHIDLDDPFHITPNPGVLGNAINIVPNFYLFFNQPGRPLCTMNWTDHG